MKEYHFSRIESEYIAHAIVNKSKSSKHLLDQLERMESVARKQLDNEEKIRQFLNDFISSSTVYFSYQKLNQYTTIVSTPPAFILDYGDKLIELRRRAENDHLAGKIKMPLPYYLLPSEKKEFPTSAHTYVYCVNKNNVLLFVLKLAGSIFLSLLNEFDRYYRFSAVTFLNFEVEAKAIENLIINNAELQVFNMLMQGIISDYRDQCDLANEHYEMKKIDDAILEGLDSYHIELVSLFMSITDSYNDILQSVYNKEFKISNVEMLMYEISKKIENTELEVEVISAPSFILPKWFIVFFESLSEEAKDGLKQARRGIRNYESELEVLLEKFYYSLCDII